MKLWILGQCIFMLYCVYLQCAERGDSVYSNSSKLKNTPQLEECCYNNFIGKL